MSDTPKSDRTILSHLSVLRLTGDKSAELLQGQSTCDVSLLSESEFQPGVFCTPQGRVIANFMMIGTKSAIYLIIDHSMVATVDKHLHKFALLYRVELTVPAYCLYGASTPISHTLTCGKWPDNRWLAIADSEPDMLLLSIEDWQVADIKSGMVWINDSLSEKLLPQQINSHWQGGVSFSKGCYTGQEVVARLHYKGKITKFTRLCETETTTSAGQHIYQHHKQVGEILNAQSNWCLCLVNQTIDPDSPVITENGDILSFRQLPYRNKILEDKNRIKGIGWEVTV